MTGGLGQTQLTNWILNWLDRVKFRTGVRPMVYTSPAGWVERTGNSTAVANAGYDLLWIAHWTSNASPTVPANNWGGRGWTFWQYSNCGSVPGISGCVDVDRYKAADVTPVKIRAFSATNTGTQGKTGRLFVDGVLRCGYTCTSYSRLANGGDVLSLTATGVDTTTTWVWGGACAGAPVGGTCSVPMTEDRAVSITFVPTTQPLSVTLSGSGTGSVTSSPTGLSCSTGTCTAPFSYGTQVTLTPSPAIGSAFTGWGGACTGTGACTVPMDQARSVTASFAPATAVLTMSVAGTGSGTMTAPTNVVCRPTCSATYPLWQPISLSTTVPAGSRFVGWGGACTGTAACSVTMSAAKSVSATFALVYSRTITLTGPTSARKGTFVTLGGTLSTSNATSCPASGRTVGLYTSSTSSTPVATATTGASGGYTFSQKLAASTTYTVRALEVLPATLGDPICGAATASLAVTATR